MCVTAGEQTEERPLLVVQTLLEHSLPVNGAKIYNIFPRELRECRGTVASLREDWTSI